MVIANLGYFIWQMQTAHITKNANENAFYFDERLPGGEILVLLTERIVPPDTQNRSAVAPVSSQSLVSNDVHEVVGDAGGLAARKNVSESAIVAMEKKEEGASRVSGYNCWKVGPFLSELVSAEYELLANSAGNTKFLSDELGVEKEHWVLIPPRTNRQESLTILRDLQEKGVDSYLVSDGELRNAISLGLFVKELSAVRLAEKVASFGYETEVRIKEKPAVRYWVALRVNEDSSKESLSVLLRLDQSEARDIKIYQSSCEMFAQGR